MTEDPTKHEMAAVGVVLTVLAEIAREKLEPGASGERPCPVCGTALRWRVGHPTRRGIAAVGNCETPNCVSFRS